MVQSAMSGAQIRKVTSRLSEARQQVAEARLQLSRKQQQLRKARSDIRALRDTNAKLLREKIAEARLSKLRGQLQELREQVRGHSHDNAGAATTDSLDEADVGLHEQEEGHDPMNGLLRLAYVACED